MNIDKLRSVVTAKAERRLRRYRRRGEPSFSNLGASIALAGGVYAVTLALSIATVMLVPGLFWLRSRASFDEGELAMMLIFCLLSIFFGGLAAIAYAGFICLPTLTLVAVALRGLRWRPREDRLGAFCGGLVACLATLPFSLSPLPNDEAWVLLFWWLIGPVLAVLFGMAGGAVGGMKNEFARRRRDRASGGQRISPPRFSLAQLMTVMAITSLLLAGLKLLDLLTLRMLVAAAVWLLVHGLALRPALRFARWRASREQKRLRQDLAERRDRLRNHLRATSPSIRSV